MAPTRQCGHPALELPRGLPLRTWTGLHRPYEAPVVVVSERPRSPGRGCGSLPLQDFLFTLHGALAFPVVMATWMLADVPATNVLGSDPGGWWRPSTTPCAPPAALRQERVLWLLVAPVCSLVAVGIGIARERWSTTAVTMIGILVVPIGRLGIAGWLGIYFPYHPLPLGDDGGTAAPSGGWWCGGPPFSSFPTPSYRPSPARWPRRRSPPGTSGQRAQAYPGPPPGRRRGHHHCLLHHGLLLPRPPLRTATHRASPGPTGRVP